MRDILEIAIPAVLISAAAGGAGLLAIFLLG
jgi:hypothetical protein